MWCAPKDLVAAEPSPRLSREDLMELVRSTFESLLGMSVAAEACDRVICDLNRMMGGVHIAGAWNGLVLLLPTETFMRQAAAAMLDVPPVQVAMADIEDALAELCNVLGGGVKSLLPGPSALALPMVLHGSNYAVRLPRCKLLAGLRFSCQQQPLELRVLEQRVGEAAACGTPPA
jgi:chemotaxis protein CheX